MPQSLRYGGRAQRGMVAVLTAAWWRRLRRAMFCFRPYRMLRLGHFCNTYAEVVEFSGPLTARALTSFHADETERDELLDATLDGIDALLTLERQALLRGPANAVLVGVVREDKQR